VSKFKRNRRNVLRNHQHIKVTKFCPSSWYTLALAGGDRGVGVSGMTSPRQVLSIKNSQKGVLIMSVERLELSTNGLKGQLGKTSIGNQWLTF
jgi:hypothetical protein